MRKRIIFFNVLAFLSTIFSLWLLFFGITNSIVQDFNVFYYSAKTALTGNSIYIITGTAQLPFWYFPWTAWFFIPIAIWPYPIAIALYICLSVVSAIAVVHILTQYYNPNTKITEKMFILAMSLPMSYLLIVVAQMDFILLGLLVLAMFSIEKKNHLVTVLAFPFLWIKPHLLIIFTLFAFYRAGKRAFLLTVLFSICMLLVETVITPDWPIQMFNLLKVGTQRTDFIWNFTTLPNLLGSQENWAGTANLPFTAFLVIFAAFTVWKFRALPTLPLLSLALAASLFCAPRAYAYDLPLLIPALIWLTSDNFTSKYWLWLLAAFIPLLAGYSSGAYLLTALVFALSSWKAFNTLRSQTTQAALPL